ncbi:MAG: ABC transporter substrate-binding protein [Prevotella sp.]
MGKTRYICLVILLSVFVACGSSFDKDREKDKAEQTRRSRLDSVALKVGVSPTIDCLPLFVAQEQCLFDTVKADIRLKMFDSQIDIEDNIFKGKLEGGVIDLVRGQRLKSKGISVVYATSTDAYWQIIGNRKSRIRLIKQLDDKMIGMTRFSALALLADYATDSVRLHRDNVFKIQINDMNLRLKMLLNNEIDAVVLDEPYATVARMYKNNVLMDSRSLEVKLGAMVFNGNKVSDKKRRQQVDVFMKGYAAACDSIDKYGIKHYSDILVKYYKLDKRIIDSMPDIKFGKVSKPVQADLECVDKWLESVN